MTIRLVRSSDFAEVPTRVHIDGLSHRNKHLTISEVLTVAEECGWYIHEASLDVCTKELYLIADLQSDLD